MLQQLPLQRQSATKTGKAAIAADDTVARNDKGDGIGAVGRANRPGRVGVADGLCDRAVGRGAPVRNVAQRFLDQSVKLRAFGVQFK